MKEWIEGESNKLTDAPMTWDRRRAIRINAVRSVTFGARAGLKSILKRVGLLPMARRIVGAFTDPRTYQGSERRFRELKRKHGCVLGASLNSNPGKKRVALVCSPGFPEVEVVLGLIKGLQLANYYPVVLIPSAGGHAHLLAEHYRLTAVEEIHEWNEFTEESDIPLADAIIDQHETVQALLDFELFGVRVGRFAVSSALRRKYIGSLDLHVAEDRDLLVDAVGKAVASANGAQKILEQFRPDLALFVDTAYSPTGELFDQCLKSNIETIQWQQGHKSNALLFKRYSLEDRSDHPRSLSPSTWRLVRDMEWTDEHRERLNRELYNNYVSGDWYSVAGTPFKRSVVDADVVRERIGLDPNKKTAFLFPHVLWDATMFWGKCLFRDYEEWFVETVRAACSNNHVNWVIKVHPGNRRLREPGSMEVEPGEVISLRRYIGQLPDHVFVIPSDSEISTYSLFPLMDYCLTVRGTVGMEAARLGIPVITGGNGPYDNKGFTVDSQSREEYFERLRTIQVIPRLSSDQKDLADRFAYAIFIMRPWLATSITLRYMPNSKEFMSEGRVSIKSSKDWYSAGDVRAFADWIVDPSKPREFLARRQKVSLEGQ